MHNVTVVLSNCHGTVGSWYLRNKENSSKSFVFSTHSKFMKVPNKFSYVAIITQNINLLHIPESLPATRVSNHILLRFIHTASQHDYNPVRHEHLWPHRVSFGLAEWKSTLPSSPPSNNTRLKKLNVKLQGLFKSYHVQCNLCHLWLHI